MPLYAIRIIYFCMIQSFADKESERLFARRRVRKFGEIAERAYRKLVMLHAAHVLDDMRVPPGNRLEALGGDRAGQHSIRVNQQWRICFRWENGNAYDVEICDDH